MNRVHKVAIGAVLAIGATAAVSVLGVSQNSAPTRCAEGMVALGPRCCGEGQHLDHGQCRSAPARCARGLDATPTGCVAPARKVVISAGSIHVGPGDWEAQGIVLAHDAVVAAFEIDATEVTESRYAACVRAGACAQVPLSGEPGKPIVGVRRDDGAAFCAWAGGALPSRDQLTLATAGATGRRYAWGDTGIVCRRAAWGLERGPCASGGNGPEVAGSHPDGASPDGVLDLTGNVAEWTRAEGADARLGEVRGGSYRDTEAAALRSWNRREIDASARATDIGLRCAYTRPD
jgi:formylglycine-generating enzyme required for sulfatase activity